MKKDLNEIAKYEIAISKKYGKEAIRHPKADWTDEKEKEYQRQIRDLYEKEKKQHSEMLIAVIRSCDSEVPKKKKLFRL